MEVFKAGCVSVSKVNLLTAALSARAPKATADAKTKRQPKNNLGLGYMSMFDIDAIMLFRNT